MTGPREERIREERIHEVHAQPGTPYAGEVHDPSGRPVGGPPPRPPRLKSVSIGTSAVSMGSALAIAISWSQHQSIVWAIIHGFLSWLYVIWYAITR